MQGSTAQTPQTGAAPAANLPDAVDFLGLTFQPRSTRRRVSRAFAMLRN